MAPNKRTSKYIILKSFHFISTYFLITMNKWRCLVTSVLETYFNFFTKPEISWSKVKNRELVMTKIKTSKVISASF